MARLLAERIYNELEIPCYCYEAAAQKPAVASWDSKSYKGSQEFEIIADQVTSVKVVANVNNAVTKVSFDSTVAENFNSGYAMTLALSDEAGSRLTYGADKSGAEGY